MISTRVWAYSRSGWVRKSSSQAQGFKEPDGEPVPGSSGRLDSSRVPGSDGGHDVSFSERPKVGSGEGPCEGPKVGSGKRPEVSFG